MPKKERPQSRALNTNMEVMGKLIDFKLDEFVRLGNWQTTTRGVPLSIGAGMLAAISTLIEFEAEYVKVLKKFADIKDILNPSDEDVIGPPVRSEGERLLNQAKTLVEDAKKALDDLDPETALQKLKEAKQRIRKAEVRKAMKEKGIGKSWYDLLEEITAMIEYLERLLK